MKHIITAMLCICLLLSNSALVQGKSVQPGSPQFTRKSVVILKGQYAFISVNGINSKAKVKWNTENGGLEVDKKGRYSDKRYADKKAYCYIKAKKTGTWTLKCIVNKKILKCKIRVVSNAAFIGDFCDDTKSVYLDISKSGKTYTAQYGHFRLCSINNLKGTVKNGVLTLKGKFPGEEQVIISVLRKGNNIVLKFKKVKWKYLKAGDTFILKKCSGEDGYSEALGGIDTYYDSYIRLESKKCSKYLQGNEKTTG
ncbi:MAG: hypothetical protein OSJ45_06810 [Lachnospiraceae bacterium]|nr:hypothetical protein [Lachnospiraceae bacterium]